MMGRVAHFVGSGLIAAVVACNALTGADSLDTEPSADDALPPRRHDLASTPVSDPTTSSSSSSSSSSGDVSSSSGGSSSGAIDAGVDAPAPPAGNTFLDAFARGDGATIGNGWSEKTDVFSLSGGAVKETGTGSYRDLLVRRPASEDALDVEIGVDVTHSAVDGDPCLYARLQPASGTTGTLVGYTFYAYSDVAYLDRDGATQSDFQELASQAISPAFVAPYTYSLSLKVTGTNPVHIVATVKDAKGDVKAMLDVNDASPGRITAPGGVAFGSGGADGARFDNFRRTTF